MKYSYKLAGFSVYSKTKRNGSFEIKKVVSNKKHLCRVRRRFKKDYGKENPALPQ
jgi:hypothetical protein